MALHVPAPLQNPADVVRHVFWQKAPKYPGAHVQLPESLLQRPLPLQGMALEEGQMLEQFEPQSPTGQALTKEKHASFSFSHRSPQTTKTPEETSARVGVQPAHRPSKHVPRAAQTLPRSIGQGIVQFVEE
jgi:hypothetical protein